MPVIVNFVVEKVTLCNLNVHTDPPNRRRSELILVCVSRLVMNKNSGFVYVVLTIRCERNDQQSTFLEIKR